MDDGSAIFALNNMNLLKYSTLAKVRHLFLYLFIALLGYEYWNKLEFLGGMTIPKLAGLGYFAFAILSYKQLFYFNTKLKKQYIVLLALWWWLAFTSLITYLFYDASFTLRFSFFQLIMLFILITNEIRVDASVEKKIKYSFLLGVLSIYVLILMGIGIQTSRESDLIEDVENVTRVWFMGLNPNSLGNLAAIAFIITLDFFKGADSYQRPVLGLLLVVYTTMISFSGSAGALLMLLLAVFGLFFLNRDGIAKKTVYLLIGCGVLLFLYSYFSDQEYLYNKITRFLTTGDTSSRTEIWAETIYLISHNPLIGVGEIYRTAHNVFLDIFKWGGIIALVLFLYFCFSILVIAYKFYGAHGSSIAIVMWGCMMFLLLKSGGGLYLKYIWVVLSLVAGSVFIKRHESA